MTGTNTAPARIVLVASLALGGCTLRNYQLLDSALETTAPEAGEDALETSVSEASLDAPLDERSPDAPSSDEPVDAAPVATDALADAPHDEPPALDTNEPVDAPTALDAAAEVGIDATAPPDTTATPDIFSPPDTLVPPDAFDAAPACATPRALCGASCVEHATDPRHCGRCDNLCPGTANGAAVCSAGACGLRCNDGFALRGGACSAVLAPRPVWPPTGSVDTSQRPRLRWELPSGVDGALVEVCSTRACTTVAQSAMATGSEVTLPSALAPGLWFWRLRGRVGAVTGTAASPAWELSIEPLRATRRSSAWGQRFDANGDGRVDLAVASSGLRLYLQRAGSLHDVSPLTLAASPEALASGDFNGDGFGDLAYFVSDAPSGLRSVLGRGDLTAGSALTPTALLATSFPSSVPLPVLVSAGDLDGDGYGDLLVYVREVSDGLYWWRGSSTGLRSGRLTLAGSTPRFVVDVAGVGDVDSDGRSDFVVTHPGGGATLWFGGSEGPTEGLELTRPSGFSADACAGAAGDLDGDGYPDFALGYAYAPGSLGSGTVLLYRGGDRTTGIAIDPWAQQQEPDTANGAFAFGTAVRGIGDSNGDGRDDLVVIASHMVRLGDRVTVVSELESGASVLGSFELPGGTAITDELRPRVLDLGWVDGDARPEFAVGSPSNSAGLGSVHLVPGTLALAGVRSIAAPMGAGRYGALLAFAPPLAGQRVARGSGFARRLAMATGLR